MTWIFRTLIIPAAYVEKAREISEALHPAAANMFNTPLSETGMFPATHYISSGLIEEEWIPALSSPAILAYAAAAGAEAQGIVLNAEEQDFIDVLEQGEIVEEEAREALQRLGLMMCAVEDDEQY